MEGRFQQTRNIQRARYCWQRLPALLASCIYMLLHPWILVGGVHDIQQLCHLW